MNRQGKGSTVLCRQFALNNYDLRKRAKTNNNDGKTNNQTDQLSTTKTTTSRNMDTALLQLPDLAFENILSFQDFDSLIAFRRAAVAYPDATSSSNSSSENELIVKSLWERTLSQLPLSCRGHDIWVARGNAMTLRLVQEGHDWCPKYHHYETLLQEVLKCANPGGDLSLDTSETYDKQRAERLLRQRWYLDVEDFMLDPETGKYPSDDQVSGFTECGWRVEIHKFNTEISTSYACRLVGQSLQELRFYNDTVPRNDRLRLARSIGILMEHVQAPIYVTQYQYRYRHSNYPSQGEFCAIMFQTQNNQKFEIEMSSCFIR